MINFYVTLCNQITSRVVLSDSILIHFAILDSNHVANRKFEAIYPLLNMFPNLVSEAELQVADMEYREIRNIGLKDFQPEELTSNVAFWNIITIKQSYGALMEILLFLYCEESYQLCYLFHILRLAWKDFFPE